MRGRIIPIAPRRMPKKREKCVWQCMRALTDVSSMHRLSNDEVSKVRGVLVYSQRGEGTERRPLRLSSGSSQENAVFSGAHLPRDFWRASAWELAI
jgi:hypothetical protein